jgi:catechol 2,3-dioxygenase-like lactoylglutathione lyase family enzyme
MAIVRYLVTDVGHSVSFYRDRLGFEVVEQIGAAFARVRRNDLTVWLSGSITSAARPMPDGAQPVPGGWNRIVLEVADIESEVARLTDAGVSFRNVIITGPGGKQILVEDPDGNPIELFEARG